MEMGTCYPCSKHLLLILNLFFWLSGLTLIVFAIYFLLQSDVQHLIHLMNLTSLPLASMEISASLLIIIGILIFLIGLFGYCGARQESRTCLILYMILVVSVLVMELALFIWMALSYDQGRNLLKQHLVTQLKSYNHLYPGHYERAVDSIQHQYQCCGIESAYDYGTSHLPLSCCSITASTPFCTIHQVGRSGTPGCSGRLAQSSLFWVKFFLIFQLGLCLLSLIGVFLAICVCQHNMIYGGYTQTFYYV